MHDLLSQIESIDPVLISGRVKNLSGLTIEATGPLNLMPIGTRTIVEQSRGAAIMAEVIGFRDDRALMMPYGPLEGISPGALVHITKDGDKIFPHHSWLGRVINAMGEPVDGLGPLIRGLEGYSLKAAPASAHSRERVGARLDLGVRALDVFTTCCRGQRLGVFAGSGVGKSVLMSMLARQARCDVVVVGMIGERGREVREFIDETLGADGLARSVVVVATSDEPALKRRQAAYMTMALCEFYRDQGLEVLCLMDSVTRFAMAQREIGLATGEPPTTKGYTPTCFAELPKLLERAGPGHRQDDGMVTGPITALFTVLVDGDDHNEPIADAVRGILDGHIVMSRSIAERGRFPAIDTLKSISRTMPANQTIAERTIVRQARELLSSYANMEELIRIGAYRMGSDPVIDRAILIQPKIEQFLNQDPQDYTSLDDSFTLLGDILNSEP
jgi:flagellum-specific ATP synthase